MWEKLLIATCILLFAMYLYSLLKIFKKYKTKFDRHDVGVGAINEHVARTVKRNERLLLYPERLTKKQLLACRTELRQCSWYLSLASELKETVRISVPLYPNLAAETTNTSGKSESISLQAEMLLQPQISKKFLLACHGYHSNPCWMLSYGKLFYETWNFNICALHERAHNGSEGSFCTMGMLESYDVHHWVNYLLEHYGTDIEIVVAGVSMGGATVLFSLAQAFPPQVKFAISDCAFDSLYNLFCEKGKNESASRGKLGNSLKQLFRKLQWTFFRKLLQYKFKLDINAFQATEVLKGNKLPLLLTHGTADTLVAYANVERIYAAAKEFSSAPVILLPIADTEHARAIEEGYSTLQAEIANWVAEYIST